MFNYNLESQSKNVRKLGKKFKVVTGPQFSEINLSKEKKKELQMLVENSTNEIHEFINEANHFYFVIKHVFTNEPQPFLFCSKNPKVKITSEMTHNSSVKADFLQVPLSFEQLYIFLSSL